jgi:enamine deaminase RidA (YjgF/YER057c/UK114 family)
MRTLITFVVFFILQNTIAQTPEENLKKLGLELPSVNVPISSYVNIVKVGKLLFLSGKGPLKQNGEYITGKLGNELSLEKGLEAARLTALNQLAVLKNELGDLKKVKRIVKVNGFVNSTSDFVDQSKVMNGFSDLMTEVFGEKGKHARTSIGVASLPLGMAIEVEMIVEIE